MVTSLKPVHKVNVVTDEGLVPQLALGRTHWNSATEIALGIT